jgi:hypothetical protein
VRARNPGIAGIIAFVRSWFSQRRTDSATGIWSSLTACGGPGSYNSALARTSRLLISTCGEHPAIGEQRRRVEEPSTIEAAYDRPIFGRWIVATGMTNALMIGS